MKRPGQIHGLTNLVRVSCRRVCDRLDWIEIDENKLGRLTEDVLQWATAGSADVHDEPQPSNENIREDTAEDVEEEALLILATDAINFGSGYHDVVRKRPGLSGARSMAAALRTYASSAGPLTASRLQRFTTADCARIFGQDMDGGPVEELMGLFSAALADLGRFLESRGGSAVEFIDMARGSAVTLAGALTEMTFYQDTALHHGEVVAFYKRAQITPADLQRAGIATFRDVFELTAFADNLVPHVLRVSGVLRYRPQLAGRIDRGVLLKSGSQEEVEIRAAGVHVVERIVNELAERQVDVPAIDVDLRLWELGGRARFKAVRRHRARSVFY